MARSLEEKERSLEEMERSLAEKESSLGEMASSLAEKEASIKEKTASLEEKDRSLDEKNHSLRKKNQWLVASVFLLIIASIFSINAYNSINQNITNNPLYWKGEGQAILLGKGQDIRESPDLPAAIEAFNKSLEIASQPGIFWTSQSNSETWWLKGNSYVLLGNDLKSKKDDQASQKCYIEAINCYNKSIGLYPLNYDSWIKKALIESKLNRSEDSEFSSLQAIRINPNYGFQAWGLRKDGEKNTSELTQINSNKSLTNFYLLYTKSNSGDQFSPCELPTNMSAI
jgi:tetratricopeptide (TPR) repeat protein